MASGKGGAAATLGQDGGAALRPLTVDFHEPGFASGLAREDAFTQAQGFRFQLRDEDRRQGAGAQWQWGPQNPQALDRYSYVLNNPLRYTDPSGHFIAIPAAVAGFFTAEVILEVVAVFVVYSFVTAVITCSQDPGCSSVLGRFADQLNQGVISVQEFLNSVQRSLASTQPSPPSAADVPIPWDDPSRSPGADWKWMGNGPEGSDRGNWINPQTGEALHPHYTPSRHGPHWDYTDTNGDNWRVYQDGRVERQNR